MSIKAQNAVLEAEALAQRENVRRLHAENLVRESKLRLLGYQLNPHFFFNSLNSVTALVKRDDKDGAIEMLSRIGDFIRLSLEDDSTSPHPLRDELEILQRYLEIEKVRFGDRLNSKFNISDDAANVEIPGLLLQPLIENSIKYAVGRSLSPTTIQIEASIKDEWLNIVVSDTGIGEANPSAHNASQSPGIGIKNVEERLRSIYEDNYCFNTVSNEATGFRIEISVPCNFPNTQNVTAPAADTSQPSEILS